MQKKIRDTHQQYLVRRAREDCHNNSALHVEQSAASEVPATANAVYGRSGIEEGFAVVTSSPLNVSVVSPAPSLVLDDRKPISTVEKATMPGEFVSDLRPTASKFNPGTLASTAVEFTPGKMSHKTSYPEIDTACAGHVAPVVATTLAQPHTKPIPKTASEEENTITIQLGSNPDGIVEFSSSWRIVQEAYHQGLGTIATFAIGNNGEVYTHVRTNLTLGPSRRYFREGEEGIELFLKAARRGDLWVFDG